jgi:hypothetical protein
MRPTIVTALGPRALAAVAALAAAGVPIAGCGRGDSNPGVANITSTSTSSPSSSTASSSGGGGSVLSGGGPSSGSPSGGAVQFANGPNALKFSVCMRADGVPNFPDPNAQGVIAGKSAGGLDPNSPQFQKADKACAKRYISRGGAAPSPAQRANEQASALAFSQCMRSHGEPGFPDPTFSSGGVAVKLVDGSGKALDTNSPIYQKAHTQCNSLLHIPPNSGKAGP